MNSDEIWLLQLWSGAFAAAGSGLVAVLVLYWSNRHQSKLAEIARRQAAHLAGEQLEAQERAMRRQLDEQRAEASKARYFAATGDLVAAVETCANTFRRDGDIEDAFVQMESARVRMSFDSDSPRLMDELSYWTYLIWNLTKQATIEWRDPIAEKVPLATLTSVTTTLTVALAHWHHANPEMRDNMLAQLRETRAWADDHAERYTDRLTRADP
ncbi:hypothetical protein [Arthrobacter sp. ISL-69]|uniref:hypothetical protein n=1 Tax=Arthrobacter sp. ISL-69 TaxID=2819113 RepID=UPI001BE61204|nr:hypothetical protein [Arthrobacter sp. ISL-69]MBT2536248.1 hypothetical protein [Arthrobacter sp. ISL-69]